MENINNNKEMVNRSGKVWAGLFIVGIGALLLLRNFGLYLPHWVFSWSTILILIGLFVGARHNFRNSGWFVMVLIGAYFTLEDIFRGYDMSNIVFPIMLVALGLFLVLKPKSVPNFKRNKWSRKNDGYNTFEKVNPLGQESDPSSSNTRQDFNANDYIDSVNVFGGSNQVIYSKNLKGGEITAVFGGGDINLTQSDFEGQIVLDVTAIFGGVKIVVPPTWQIKSEVTAVFGGVDDKRAIYPATEQANKLIIIRGVVLFGGVEFKSY
ncbi:LiaF transmembrane domain-containing protein [Pedobacter sp. SL55]|uniref:LiaF transmembrane domain-containing protein n=1 Tax=Pedobacter sp. SL55 TaxID=2995161 RepID=UPI00226FC792|nr:LiaF domain-containing protein [Pedobacter sp. SL55]WAC40899.1 LiaF-related protein [Pedobacter sp. SL55]